MEISLDLAHQQLLERSIAHWWKEKIVLAGLLFLVRKKKMSFKIGRLIMHFWCINKIS